MMAAQMTFERFKARADEALAAAARVRRALRHHGYLPILAVAYRLLAESHCRILLWHFLGTLNHQWIGSLNAKQTQEVADHLGELHGTLAQVMQIAETRGLTDDRWHRGFFEQVDSARQRVADVLEALHLATNENFWQLITKCLDGLHSRSVRRDWRASLATMRD